MCKQVHMQNLQTDWKEKWNDDYLKWLSTYANADGDKLVIDINDDGAIEGISDVKKLLTEIPNKAKDIIGIVPQVILRKKYNVEYL
jgi:ATP-dependent DNA helicase RecG